MVKESRDNYWMLNWLDEYMEGHKGFICGGCFKNIFNKEKVKDLDIFFETENDYVEAVEWYDSKTKGWCEGSHPLTEEEATYRFLYENNNVKAYIHKETGIRIELCCKIFGKAEEILNQFDFTITKFAYYKELVEDNREEDISELMAFGLIDEKGAEKLSTHIEYRVMFHEKFFEHLHTGRLVTDDKILFPMSTFERSYRYAKYGYFPCKETKLKIIKAINELTPEQIEVSESLYDGMD